jgi:hypothetical protein
VLDRVKIGGVWRPIRYLSDPPGSEPLRYTSCSVYRGIILHEDIPSVQILKDWSYFCLIDLEVRPRRVPMLLRLEIPVYNIAIRLPGILKGSLDYNLYILLRAVGLYHLFIPFLSRRTEAPLRSVAPPPLHRTLVTLTDQSPLLASPSFMREALSKPFKCVSFYKL